jgi:hypothetical protein
MASQKAAEDWRIMTKVTIVVKHRKIPHNVVIELPDNFEDMIETFSKKKIYDLFTLQLKTNLASKAWTEMERESKGEDGSPSKAGWRDQLPE